MSRWVPWIGLLAAGLLLAACGGKDPDTGDGGGGGGGTGGSGGGGTDVTEKTLLSVTSDTVFDPGFRSESLYNRTLSAGASFER